MHDIVNELEFFTVIVGRKQRKALVEAVSRGGGRAVNIVYGKGSVDAGYLKDAFGLVQEENKVVITCLLSKKRSAGMFEMLIREFHFDKPNTGIAFAVPVDRLLF